MQYFDFHTHIILKQLFDDNPNIDAKISRSDIAGIPQACTDLGNIIQTQIHQSQLAEFQDEIVVGVALYALESFLAREVGPLRQHLKSGSRHKLSATLLSDIVNNDVTAFTNFIMSRTLDRYLNAPESFNVITKQSFNSPLPKNKVNIFFVVEGCHSFVDSHNEFTPPNKSFPPNEILANLDLLLARVPVVSINLTHLQQSNLCNHAFGIQLTNSIPFYPHGNGLQDDGATVVQGIFDRGICVDLKHMSYKSRADLMNEIDGNRYQNVQPLLCTHAGFTGVPFSEWPGYISMKRPVSDTFYLEVSKTMHTKNQPRRPGAPAFNMTTINLFDEEIAWIVNNNGMIGLSMDRRILGYVDKFDSDPTGLNSASPLVVDKEHISKSEWASLQITNSSIGTIVREENGDLVTMDDLEQSAEQSIPARNEYFFDHVLLHLKHFLQVCVDAGIPLGEAQKHITIGSDFDGLINPFLNMQVAEDMKELKEYISMNFRFYLESLTDSSQWASQIDERKFADDLFYNNGFNYIKSLFSR